MFGGKIFKKSRPFPRISKNKTFKLNPTINYIDNSSKSDSLYYIIENKKIASISPNGEIKALSSGETTIKVYSQYFDNPLIIPISVYSLAESINVETNPMILNIGDKHKIVYNVYPEDAINNEILFKKAVPLLKTYTENNKEAYSVILIT